MKWFFLMFLFVVSAHSVMAQSKVAMDSSVVTVRSVRAEAIQKFKQDQDFQYETFREPPQSLWSKFWIYIWYEIGQIMSTRPGRITVWTILVIIALAVIAFFIAKVMGMNKASLFSRSSSEILPYTVSTDNIHGISFEEAINDAVRNGDLRLAVRLLYLQSLKNLSDSGYIDWRINKTNTDYISEVTDRPWHSLFRFLTHKFEYAWYGEISMNKDDFENLQLQFHQFNNQLQ